MIYRIQKKPDSNKDALNERLEDYWLSLFGLVCGPGGLRSLYI